MKVIRLTAKRSNYDKEPHYVLLEKEDEDNWYGKPISNPACPALQYPKFAWNLS